MPRVATASVPEILFSPQLIKNTLGEDQRHRCRRTVISTPNIMYVYSTAAVAYSVYGCKFVESENASLFSFISVIKFV